LHSIHSLHNLPDADLIPLCLQHQSSAWNAFFKRFSPVIKKAIRRTFIKCGAKDFAADIDNVMDIHADIVAKLYAKGALNQCPDLSGVRSWIVRISANQTVDWMKRRGRIKNVPQVQEEMVMRRLNAPLGDDLEFTLQDVIEDEDADIFAQLEQIAIQSYVESVIEQISTIDNITHRWILRLHILGQLALSDAEIENLQTISPLQGDDLTQRIDALETSLAEKEQERQDNVGRAVLYWHQLRSLEVKISRLERDTFSDHTIEIDALKMEWSELDIRKKKLLAGCHLLPKPTNREIAELVGIPEDSCGNVSNYLVRARTALLKKMENVQN
jgi:RNA polymerase sigma factor (sigma-70 family)